MIRHLAVIGLLFLAQQTFAETNFSGRIFFSPAQRAQLEEDTRAPRISSENVSPDEWSARPSRTIVSGGLLVKNSGVWIWTEDDREAGTATGPVWRFHSRGSSCTEVGTSGLSPLCILPGPAFRVAVSGREDSM